MICRTDSHACRLLGSTQTTCFRMCKKQVFTIACSLPSLRVMAIAPARRFLQSGSVLGTLWYPTAVPENPSAFCFLASVRECPVKLLDASDGRVNPSISFCWVFSQALAPCSFVLPTKSSTIERGKLHRIVWYLITQFLSRVFSGVSLQS